MLKRDGHDIEAAIEENDVLKHGGDVKSDSWGVLGKTYLLDVCIEWN